MFKYIFDYSSSIDLCLGDLKVTTRVHDKKTPFAHKQFSVLKSEGRKEERKEVLFMILFLTSAL